MYGYLATYSCIFDATTRTGTPNLLTGNVCDSLSEAPESVSSITHTGETERRSLAPIGGKGVLDCRVRAAPSPTFTWTAGDKEIVSDGRKYIIHVPQVKLHFLSINLAQTSALDSILDEAVVLPSLSPRATRQLREA